MLARVLLEKYREKVKSKNVEYRYAALTFALQLPDICSNIEYNNDATYRNEFNSKYTKLKRKSENLYKFWINEHFIEFWKSFKGMIGGKTLANYCYSSRCALIHDGRLIGKEIKMFFVLDEEGIWWFDDVFIIDLCLFCNVMFSVAFEVFDKYKTEFFTFNDIVISNEVYKKIYTNIIEREFNFYRQKKYDLNRGNMDIKLRKIYYYITRLYENNNVWEQIARSVKKGNIYKLEDDNITSFITEDDIDGRFIVKDNEGNISININKKYYDIMNNIDGEIKNYYKQNPVYGMEYISRIKTDTKIDILRICERPIIVFVEKFGGNQQ